MTVLFFALKIEWFGQIRAIIIQEIRYNFVSNQPNFKYIDANLETLTLKMEKNVLILYSILWSCLDGANPSITIKMTQNYSLHKTQYH